MCDVPQLHRKLSRSRLRTATNLVFQLESIVLVRGIETLSVPLLLHLSSPPPYSTLPPPYPCSPPLPRSHMYISLFVCLSVFLSLLFLVLLDCVKINTSSGFPRPAESMHLISLSLWWFALYTVLDSNDSLFLAVDSVGLSYESNLFFFLFPENDPHHNLRLNIGGGINLHINRMPSGELRVVSSA